MSIRIAVIGAGIMGADHARIVAHDLPGATLQVVCDMQVGRARTVAEETGARDVATDPEAVIARPDVDAVIIASTDETHAPLTLAALDAGKPVLCEKPLAPGLAECLEVVEAEVRLGRQLIHLGFMRRFDPSYAAMKAALKDGSVGRALMMHNFHRNVESPGAWFTGVMAISNSAPHEYDIARFVLDTEFRTVMAHQPIRSDDMVAPVFLTLETVDDQLVNIEINNNAAYGYDVRGELIGEKGAISLKSGRDIQLDYGLRTMERYPADWRPRFAEAYRMQNKAWLSAIVSEKPSPVAANAWDGYCASLVAEAGVRALNGGRKVAIEMARRPSLYESIEQRHEEVTA